MARWTKLCKNALLFAAVVSELLGRPFANGTQSVGEHPGSQEVGSNAESTSPARTLQASSKASTTPPSMASLLHVTTGTGTASQPDEVDDPQVSTNTRHSTPLAVSPDNRHLFVVPLMLAGLGLFHKLLSHQMDSIEEGTLGVAFLLGGLVLCLFLVALVSFLLAQGFPLPETMCIWKIPAISETPCNIMENAKAHTYATEPTVEQWVTLFSWGFLNLSYNLLAWALIIGLICIFIGAGCTGLSIVTERMDEGDHCLPFLMGLGAAAGLWVLGMVAFLVVLGATVAYTLLFASFCVLVVSLVLVPISAVYASLVSSTTKTFGGSASVATGWRRTLQQLTMVLLTWAGGSVSFITDLCNMTTALQTWLQGGCGGEVVCQAFGLVGEWLLQAFPWLPRVVKWLFVEYQEAFEFAYKAASSLGMLLQVECDGLRGLFLTSLLCGGMASICITQKRGTTEALARLKTQTECSPRIHTFVLCGVCQFISTRLTELFITMGNGAFIHTVIYSAAFLVNQPGSNPACVSGPDGFLGVISLPFLWSATLFSLYFLFDLVFKVKVDVGSPENRIDNPGAALLTRLNNLVWLGQKDLVTRLGHNVQKSMHDLGAAVQKNAVRNSVDNLGAVVLTSLGLWHDQEWCGSNMKLLKIKETIARVEEGEARVELDTEAMEGWRRAFAKNIMQAYADFLSTSLMVLPLGVVLGKLTQCSNAGSLLAWTSLPLPESCWGDHMQKLLALLRFCLLLLIPLLPESVAPSLLVVGVVLVGLESLLKAGPAVPVRCIRPEAPRVHPEASLPSP